MIEGSELLNNPGRSWVHLITMGRKSCPSDLGTGVGLVVGDDVTDGLGDGLGVAVGLVVGDGVTVGEAVAVGDGLDVAVGVVVGDGVADGLGVAVGPVPGIASREMKASQPPARFCSGLATGKATEPVCPVARTFPAGLRAMSLPVSSPPPPKKVEKMRLEPTLFSFNTTAS